MKRPVPVETFNIYCDESCHLEQDGQPIMALGAVWCPTVRVPEIRERVREIRRRHGLSPRFEIKWSKVSPAKCDFYLDLVDYFFDDDHLHFRALIVPDKSKLNHQAFGQTHDEWYYKMYFDLLKVLIDPDYRYRIYIDVKDTLGATKVAKLHEVLSNAKYDFSRQIIERIQVVRSEEVVLLQLADLLLGAVSYANRGLASNEGKVRLVERLRRRSGRSLLRSTLVREQKVNIFRWAASETLG